MMSYVQREFSSVRWKMMKEDLGVSNAQAWGCPCAPPINIQGDSSVYAWGCPRASPSSSTIISSSLVPLYYYHFMRCVLCLERLALYFSRFVFCFVCCSNKLDPSLLFCVGEIHALLELELLIGFACLFSF